MMISMTLMACTLNSGAQNRETSDLRSAVGITNFLSGNRLGIEIGHSIGNNWSVSGITSIKFADTDAEDEDMLEQTISCHYWPHQAYEGPDLFMELETSSMKGYRLSAGIGYICHIWKGLMVGASFRSLLIGAASRRPQDDRVRITLYYGF